MKKLKDKEISSDVTCQGYPSMKAFDTVTSTTVAGHVRVLSPAMLPSVVKKLSQYSKAVLFAVGHLLGMIAFRSMLHLDVQAFLSKKQHQEYDEDTVKLMSELCKMQLLKPVGKSAWMKEEHVMVETILLLSKHCHQLGSSKV
jgi:hypothetical protein